MTHIELLEAMVEDFAKDFKENPTTDEKVESFRQGVLYAYSYLAIILKNGDAEMLYGEKIT